MKMWQMIAVIFAFFFVGFLINLAIQDLENDKQRKIQRYQECKEKTQDLEWCFKQFRPQL